MIIDAGSGIVGLGPALVGPPRDLPILLTHYHWDHLQGLPFLSQLYSPGWKPTHPRAGARSQSRGLARGAVPVALLSGPPRAPAESPRGGDDPVPGTSRWEGSRCRRCGLNHPGGALAFRVRGMTGDLVYATDHEFGDPAFDEPLADFARGAAALVLDAHFTPEEFRSHRGWGHSHWRQCAEFASRVDAGGLWLFHHKPGRTDEALVRIRPTRNGYSGRPRPRAKARPCRSDRSSSDIDHIVVIATYGRGMFALDALTVRPAR